MRALKTADVGFATGLAGKPHHDVSIVRAIVELSGPARYMPWNSTKSGINPNSGAFKSIQQWLHTTMREFGTLARRLKGTWSDEIFPHRTGGVVEERLADFSALRRCLDIPMPRRNIPYREQMAELNAELSITKPWTLGLYEGVVAADAIWGLRIRQKARIALIVLDSTLEIAFKDFLVHESGQHYSNADLVRIFAHRYEVVLAVRRHKPDLLDEAGWRRAAYFYGQRCNLVHERSTSGVDEQDVEEYRRLVQRILHALFGIRFAERDS